VRPGLQLTVDGTGTPGNRSTPLTLTVSTAPDYALSLSPTALTITQGRPATATVTLTRTNFTGAVTLVWAARPRGHRLVRSSRAHGTSSTLTVSAGAAVAPGTYNLTVDGTGTPGNRSTPLTLTVSAAPDYTLSLSPAALTIVQGATGTSSSHHPHQFHGPGDVEFGRRSDWGHGGVQSGGPHGNELHAHGERRAAVAPGPTTSPLTGPARPGIARRRSR